MLQAGRSQFRFKVSLDFSTDLILPAALWPYGRLILLTEMSTRNLPGGKGRPVCKADNLTAICEPLVYKMWQPRYLTTLWASKACYRDSFIFFTFYRQHKNQTLTCKCTALDAHTNSLTYIRIKNKDRKTSEKKTTLILHLQSKSAQIT
jgi:hypothetical protein